MKDKLRIQQVLGTMFYYGHAVDGTILPSIGTMATQQSTPTAATLKNLTQLLNYLATYPDAIIRYTRSNMCLHVESDASYLSESRARSRFTGYHYLSSTPKNSTPKPAPDTPQPKLNGPISIPAKILKEVVSSAAEAESAGLFIGDPAKVHKSPRGDISIKIS
jgi:hypothetical protein